MATAELRFIDARQMGVDQRPSFESRGRDSAREVIDEARQMMKRIQDGVFWEETNALAMAGSFAQFHPEKAWLYSEFHRVRHSVCAALQQADKAAADTEGAEMPDMDDVRKWVCRMQEILTGSAENIPVPEHEKKTGGLPSITRRWFSW